MPDQPPAKRIAGYAFDPEGPEPVCNVEYELELDPLEQQIIIEIARALRIEAETVELWVSAEQPEDIAREHLLEFYRDGLKHLCRRLENLVCQHAYRAGRYHAVEEADDG